MGRESLKRGSALDQKDFALGCKGMQQDLNGLL